MKKLTMMLLCLVAVVMGSKAQMGYQISLLNTATSEPRANETVTVSVSLSNNANEVFYTETKSATTNDFGVLSLSIGNADTFANVDFSKMPFYVEVSANGVSIGKSQILSVPVAEYAKRAGGLCKDSLVGTWVNDVDYYTMRYDSDYTYKEYHKVHREHIFNADGTFTWKGWYKHYTDRPNDYTSEGERTPITGEYVIDGNTIHLLISSIVEDIFWLSNNPLHRYKYNEYYLIYYIPSKNILIGGLPGDLEDKGLSYTKQ